MEKIQKQIKWLQDFQERWNDMENIESGYGGRETGNRAKAQKLENELCDEYDAWVKENGLPEMSADELECELREIDEYASSEKFCALLEWWRAGHKPESGYGWQEETFEEARRIFGADYQQTGGFIYVGMLKLGENVYCAFSDELIRIIKGTVVFDDCFDMLQEENIKTFFLEYVSI